MSATAPDGDPAAADVRPAADDDGSPYLWVFRRYLLAAVAPVSVLACNSLTEPKWECTDGSAGWSITFIDPWIARLCWGLAISLAFVIAVELPDRWRRGWLTSRGACVLGFLATLCGSGAGGLSRSMTWSIQDERDGPDAHRYAFLTAGFVGGHSEALAVESAAGAFQTRCTALYEVNVDGVYWYGAMIRPFSPTPHRLAFGHDGHVSAVSNGLCAWVFDLRKSSGVSGEALPSLSPFLLLGASETGDESDLAAIASEVTHPERSFDSPGGLPTEASLLDALGHANPWVRAAARRIIEAGGAEMYPEATRRIATERK